MIGSKVNSRIEWIDVAKGIAILLMVIGHLPELNPYARGIIFSFHMPLFFIINGILIKNYDFVTSFKRSCNSLLLPYFLICFLETIISMMLASDNSQAGILLFSGLDDMIMGISTTSTLFTKYGSVWLVWFVICLFISRNIYIAGMSVLSRKGGIFSHSIFVIVVSSAGYLIGKYYAYMPWSLDVAMYSVIFIAVGEILRKTGYFEKRELKFKLVPLIIWILFLASKKHIELATRDYPFVYGGAIAAIAGSICILFLSRGIEKYFKPLSLFLSWYGKNSILVLGIHCLEMRFIPWDNILFSENDSALAVYARDLVRFLLILVLAFLIPYFYSKIREISIKHEKNSWSHNTERMEWPDIAKGICIIAVIAGHMGISYINQLVYLWHLPVFFLISGFFLKLLPDSEIVKNKAKKLLIPYYLTCFVICVIAALKAVIKGNSAVNAVLYWIGPSLYAAGDDWTKPVAVKAIGAIWFLWALFFGIMISNHFMKKRNGISWIALISFIGWASYMYFEGWFPLSIQAGMLASAYIAIGYIVRNNGKSLCNPSFPVLLLAIFAGAWGIQHFNGFWLVHNFMGNGWDDFVSSLGASIVVICISELISRKSIIIKRIFAFFGINSLLILCIHLIELNILPMHSLLDKLGIQTFLFLNEFQYSGVLFLTKVLFVVICTLIINMIPTIKLTKLL